jgi:uncharacterized membrane protein YfhO
VDGKEVDIILIGDAMIAVPLAEGSHTVTFSYHNSAYSLGWKITLACALIFAALVWMKYKPKHQKGKFER